MRIIWNAQKGGSYVYHSPILVHLMQSGAKFRLLPGGGCTITHLRGRQKHCCLPEERIWAFSYFLPHSNAVQARSIVHQCSVR